MTDSYVDKHNEETMTSLQPYRDWKKLVQLVVIKVMKYHLNSQYK